MPKFSTDIDIVDKTIKESDKIIDNTREEYYFCNSEFVGLYWENIDNNNYVESRSYKVAKVK